MYRITYKYKPLINILMFKLQRQYSFLGLKWWHTVLKTDNLSKVIQWTTKYNCEVDGPIIKLIP